VLGSAHVESRAAGGPDPEQARVLARPELTAQVSDVDYAGAVLVVDTELVDECPILDLRVRAAVRRNGVRVVVLTSRPSSLDPNAAAVVRFAPGAAEAALAALAAELGSPRAPGGAGAGERAGADADALRAAAGVLRGAGPVVMVWGEQLSHGARGSHAVDALLAVAAALRAGETDGGGLLEVPAATNGRGLREVGCVPSLGPGLSDAPAAGKNAPEIARALGDELSTLILMQADPLADYPERPLWESALGQAGAVIAFADFATPGLIEHAAVVFPAESYAEKEGTMTHPDGRLQRVRQALGHPGGVRSQWRVLAELCERLGKGLDVVTAPQLTAEVAKAVPFYGGVTLEEIGGHGVRWQDRDAASAAPETGLPDSPLEEPPELPEGMRLGVVRSLWTGRETEHAGALRFLAPRQRVELAPADAERLGVSAGDQVVVSADDQSVRAAVALRHGVPPGSVFLIAGTTDDNATALLNGQPRTVEVSRA
jgi:NADH-quinone oxidoreductase subunit G